VGPLYPRALGLLSSRVFLGIKYSHFISSFLGLPEPLLFSLSPSPPSFFIFVFLYFPHFFLRFFVNIFYILLVLLSYIYFFAFSSVLFFDPSFLGSSIGISLLLLASFLAFFPPSHLSLFFSFTYSIDSFVLSWIFFISSFSSFLLLLLRALFLFCFLTFSFGRTMVMLARKTKG
jgi:hypothetical protein